MSNDNFSMVSLPIINCRLFYIKCILILLLLGSPFKMSSLFCFMFKCSLMLSIKAIAICVNSLKCSDCFASFLILL